MYIFSPFISHISICLDKHGQERFLYWGECRERCPRGHYADEGHTCQPCPDNCELCHSPHFCIRCVHGYFMVPANHTCQKLECRQGKTALGLLQTGEAVFRMAQRQTLLPCVKLRPGMTLSDSTCQVGTVIGALSLPLHTSPLGFPREKEMQLITQKGILDGRIVGRV